MANVKDVFKEFNERRALVGMVVESTHAVPSESWYKARRGGINCRLNDHSSILADLIIQHAYCGRDRTVLISRVCTPYAVQPREHARPTGKMGTHDLSLPCR